MMEFTYQGLVRYGYGFYNPNHAAAALVLLLPFLWYIRRIAIQNSWFRYGVLAFSIAAEFVLYLGLILTFSRSGLLAFIVSAMLWWLLTKKIRKDLVSPPYPFCRVKRSLMLISCIVLMVCFGAGQRVVATDSASVRSTANRFDLWSGGLQLLAEMPLGTGVGQSGKLFSLFIDENGKISTRTLVNSFLTFTVEYGVIAGAVYATLLMSGFLLLSYRLYQHRNGRKNNTVCAALLCALVAAVLCGMTSTCFDHNILFDWQQIFYGVVNDHLQRGLYFAFLLLVAGCIVYGAKSVQRKTVLRVFCVGCGASVLLMGGAWGYGQYRNHESGRYSLSIINDVSGRPWVSAVLKTADIKTSDEAIGFPDEQFNLSLAKHVIESIEKRTSYRLPLTNKNMIQPVLVALSEQQIPILFGDSCRSAGLAIHKNVILVRPTNLIPASELTQVRTVYLPKWDERGENSYWQRLQHTCDFKIKYVRY